LRTDLSLLTGTSIDPELSFFDRSVTPLNFGLEFDRDENFDLSIDSAGSGVPMPWLVINNGENLRPATFHSTKWTRKSERIPQYSWSDQELDLNLRKFSGLSTLRTLHRRHRQLCGQSAAALCVSGTLWRRPR
jgi:hypothetical protein